MLEEGKGSKKPAATQSSSLSDAERKIIELEAKLKAEKELNERMAQMSSSNNNNGGFTPEFLEQLMTKMGQQNDAYSKPVGDLGYVDIAQIDPDDLIEEGHAFWCHQAGYVIVDDMRQNKPVRTPLNTIIEFKYVHEIRKGSGRDMELFVLSSYVSYSKKEVEWLKNSTYYNVVIFDDIKTTATKQSRKAAKINSLVSSIRKMERKAFYATCRSHGIPMNKDAEVMILSLASLYADKALLEEDRTADQAAKNKLKEQALINEVK